MTRSFSPLERQIIDKIISIDDHLGSNTLSNLLEKRFSDFSYFIDIGPDECTINIEAVHFDEIGKSIAGLDRIKYIVQQTGMDVLRVIKLLEFLEQERLIYIISGTPTNSIGGKVNGYTYVQYRSIPADIQAAIRKYVGIVVISTEALRNLRDRDYLSEEEVRYRESASFNRKTIWGL